MSFPSGLGEYKFDNSSQPPPESAKAGERKITPRESNPSPLTTQKVTGEILYKGNKPSLDRMRIMSSNLTPEKISGLVVKIKNIFPTALQIKILVKSLASPIVNPLLEGTITDKLTAIFSQGSVLPKQQAFERAFIEDICLPLKQSKDLPSDIDQLADKTLDALQKAKNLGILDKTLVSKLLLRVDIHARQALESRDFSIHDRLLDAMANRDDSFRQELQGYFRSDLVSMSLLYLNETEDPPETQTLWLQKHCPEDLLQEGLQETKKSLQTEYRENLLTNFENQVTAPLRDMEADDPNFESRLSVIGYDTTDVLVNAQAHGVLDLQGYKAIMGEATRASGIGEALGKPIALHDKVASSLKMRGDLGLKIMEKMERYQRQESTITTLDNIAVYTRELNDPEVKLANQHKWLNANCPQEALKKANFPKEPPTDKKEWEDALQRLDSALKIQLREDLVALNAMTNPTEREQAIKELATMCAFGGRSVNDLGDNLRGACSTRADAIRRYEIFQDVSSPSADLLRKTVIDCMLSDAKAILDNSYIAKSSEVKLQDCKAGDYLKVGDTILQIVEVSRDQENKPTSVTLSTGEILHPQGPVILVTKNDYFRETLLSSKRSVLQKATDQLNQIEKWATTENQHQAIEAIRQKTAPQLEQVKSSVAGTVSSLVQHVETLSRPPNDHGLTASQLKQAIEQAVTQNPDFNVSQEVIVKVDGKEVILLLTRGQDKEPEVLIRGIKIGQGAASIVYRALSAKTAEARSLKYAAPTASSDMADNEIAILQRLDAKAVGDGVPKPMQKTTFLQANGKETTMIVGAYYEHRDLGKSIFVIKLAQQTLGLKEAEITPGKIAEKMVDLQNRLFAEILQKTTPEEKRAVALALREEIGTIFEHFMGSDKLMELTRQLQSLESPDKIRELLNDFAVALEETYLPQDTQQKSTRSAELVKGLARLIEKGIFHGDLKPLNTLCDNSEAVVADFDSARTIQDLTKLMHATFRFANEEEKEQMSTFLQALRTNNTKTIQTMREKHPNLERLLTDWKIVTPNAEGPVEIADKKKFDELRSYLMTSFHPTKTTGYASKTYAKLLADFFWSGQAKNFEQACYAFDMRAMGVSLYEYICNGALPLGEKEKDPAYYTKMQNDLIAQGLSPKAASFIRKMAEPVAYSGGNFNLPISQEDLKELQMELKNFTPQG